MSAALEMRGVYAGYGPFRALFDVNLTIAAGEAVALVGSNGAGKTSLARVASGLVTPSEGSVVVNGRDLTRSPAYRYARAGVAHAPEGRSVFATLTVEENLELSIHRIRGRKGLKAGLEQAYALYPVLGERRQQLAGTLSGGEQRMLTMARVLVDSPRLLIADELSLGLAPLMVQHTYEALQQLRQAGVALLVIEQHVTHALALCDRVVILDRGTPTWVGSSEQARTRLQTVLHSPPSSN